ncbi:MAG: Ldh family oxidoreductase [Trueperaceae bacterium]|nr:Ldh family oxidoreductase [Trueperaceae bacterium]
MPRVDAQALERFGVACFEAMGLTSGDARICADALMQSELRYHPGQGQGIRRLVAYRDRIAQGRVHLGAPFEILKESPALALVDAHNGLGSVIGRRAMDLACEKAAVCGVGTVVVRGSTHYGSSSVHARAALAHGHVGLAFTNAGPEMAGWGGRTPVVGTNPWGIAAPTGGDFPVVLDIALTTAGKGMMRFLADRGQSMPRDWALTPEGHETDDPTSAMAGALLGIGQYKGVGLSFFTDVLTGVLSGGGFGTTPYSDPSKLDVSHTFVAYDVAWFMPIETFHARMQEFIAMVKSSDLRPGFDEVLVPGELEHRRETAKRADGVPLPQREVDDLVRLGADLGVDASALRAGGRQ